MNLFESIGNFFGLGKKKKEDKPRQQVTIRRPTPNTAPFKPQRPQNFGPTNNNQQPFATVKMPGVLIPDDPKKKQDPFTPLNIGGVKVQAPVEVVSEKPDAPKPVPAKPAPKLTPASSTAGQRLDAALAAPKKNVGTTKVKELVPSIARGIVKGVVDLGDFAVDAGTHIVDNGLGKNGIGGIFGKNWSPKLVDKTKGISGGIRKASNWLEDEQIKANGADAVNNALFAGGQFIDPAVIVGGTGKALIKGSKLSGVRTTIQRSEDELAAAKTGQELAAQERLLAPATDIPTDRTRRINQQNVDEAIRQGEERANISTIEPSYQKRNTPEGPITTVPTAPRAPAITSPNRPVTTVKPPTTFVAPEVAGVRPPVIEAPRIPETTAIKAPTPDEAVAEAQRAIDEAAVRPVTPAPVAQALDVESPIAAESRVIAENSPPVAPVSEADLMRPAVNQAPTDAIAGELGTISRRAAAEGRLTDDVSAEALGNQVGDAIEAESNRIGTTWEAINKKVQAAWSNNVKSPAEAGLSPEEFDIARKAADELSLLRSRVDPSLLKDGQVGQFYSPRQTKDTEFTQELVNELSRDRKNGLSDRELDLSTTPYRQAVRRYSNAPEAMGDKLIDSLETKTVKDGLGNERVVETGLKVPDDVKTAFREDLKPYVKAQDDAIRAADAGDIQGIDRAIAEGDKAIDDALTKMAAKLPKDTQEARDAIGAMIAERRAYMQSTVRTNMFTNVVNRMFDQTQKAIVNFGDQALPLVNKISNKMIGGNQPGVATDFTSTRLAKKYAKGTLINQQNRNFATNVRLAGANAQNPVTKGLAKVDAVYRSAGTYLTSLGDMSTNAVKATNLVMLGRGRAEGLKTVKELEEYLVKNLNSPEYLDVYRNMNNQYAGYIGMPQTLTSTGEKGGKLSDFMSKIDNFAKNALDQTPLPDRIKQEINDLIMPAITGFAGATSRVAAKQLNALALGIPNIRRGLKLAASDSPNAKAIGQMMISRSIIDGVSAAGVGTAGLMLGSSGKWTGEYPEDPNERARWESEGIQANAFSFDVDGKTVYIQPGRILGVLALPAVLPAVVGEAMRNGTDPGESIKSVIQGTIGQFNENLGADAIVSHIGDIDSILNNKQDSDQAKKNLMNMLGYSISNLNPGSGLQNNVANALDDKKRDTSGGILDVIKNRNPFTRPGLDTKKDNLGNDIENRSQLSLGSAAVTVGDGQNSDEPAISDDGSVNLEGEISRLSKAKFEVMPGKDIKNSNSQDDAKTLMGSELYKNADDETKASYLKDTLLGTKTKDINKNLNAGQRSALIEYKLQNEDQRKKWLESNDNAAIYYESDYNNKDANGLLTDKDQNLENKSGAKYKMLRAKVDKEFQADSALKQLYENVSETEWKAMTNPDSEDYDPETAGKLLEYDDARTKAGVSGKSSTSSKNKYVLKTAKGGKGSKGGGRGGSGGGGGSGASGGEKFVFASIPDSILSGVTASSKGYAEDAPTFQPIADLRAPTTADIPKGRTISVKRGIQI